VVRGLFHPFDGWVMEAVMDPLKAIYKSLSEGVYVPEYVFLWN